MEDVFDAAWREHPATHDTQVDATLATLIDIRGLALLDDPRLLRQLLLRSSPDAQRHVDTVLVALSANLPRRLAAAKDDVTLPALLQRAAQDLQDHAGLDAEWSNWAVRTWAHAFALPMSGLDGAASVDPAPSFASPIASARPVRADGFDHVGAGVIGGLWDHGPLKTVDPRPPLREPTLRQNDDFVASRSEPIVPFETHAPATDPAMALEESPILVEPLFPDRTQPPEPQAEAVVASPWIHDERPTPPRTRSIVGPLVIGVLVLVAAAAAWFALEGVPWSTSSKPVASSAAPPIASVASTTQTPADSAPEPLAPPPAAPASGPTTTETTPPADEAEGPRSAPATGAPESAPPAASNAAAAPPIVRAPVIARIAVPTVVEGAPFSVALQLESGTRDVTSVERRIVDRSGAWPAMPTRFQASGLPRGGDRTLLVPFRAMDAPSRAVVEFVAVGRDGGRSEPKRVAIALIAPDPAPAALDVPTGCTSSTCGVVIESREIEPEVGTRGAIYQLAVRMDDRQVVTSTAPYRLQVGSRARLAGTRLVPADRGTP